MKEICVSVEMIRNGVKPEAMGRTAQGGDDLCRVLGHLEF